MKKNKKTKAVDLAKTIAKTRDGYVCQKCGRSKEQGWAIHGAHIMPVSWGGTAADPENIIALCATCHSMGKDSAHDNPVGFGIWYEKHYPNKYAELRQKALDFTASGKSMDWEEVAKDLKNLIDKGIEEE